jgi:hypothetical protein
MRQGNEEKLAWQMRQRESREGEANREELTCPVSSDHG